MPVLSEQMQLVDPRVSTASRFLQRTFFSASLFAVRVKPTVTSTIRPSGTLAVMIPIAKMKFRIAGYPTANPRPNNRAPTATAKAVSLIMNLLIYFLSGDSSVLALAARFAICPMKVLSPVAKTTPLPVPYLLRVEKKAMFFVSNGLSLVQSADLAKSSVSPVKDELSTFIPCESIILKSAGIFLPSSILTTSPTTSLVASNLL